MSFAEAIARKRDGDVLTPDDVELFVQGASEQSLPAEQLAAMLMAICIRGMNDEETGWLTRGMLESGEQWNLRTSAPDAVDKHSTGGVGDTVSLIFAPLLVAVGIPVAMMAGRGLGHSQGTLDKLEAIPGFCVNRDRRETLGLLERCGAAIIAQTENIAPADRTLYALRDVTATVPSLPLIVGSIMSKKLALGAGTLILDVKCGSGAFRKNLLEAEELARALCAVAHSAGVACEALITQMDQPLGPALGTACEVRQAVAILSGGGSASLRTVTLKLAEETLVLRGRNRLQAREELTQALATGAARRAWEEMVRAHGGDPSPEALPRPRRMLEIVAEGAGVISAIDGEVLGRAAVEVGAGRRSIDESIDFGSGLEIEVRLGDRVDQGQILARVLLGDRPVKENRVVAKVAGAFSIGNEAVAPPPLVYGTPESPTRLQ